MTTLSGSFGAKKVGLKKKRKIPYEAFSWTEPFFKSV